LTRRGLRATAHFIDGNAVWTEAGRLRRTPRGFALDSDDGGVRVFPIAGRQVEVYTHAADIDDPIVQTNDGAILIDRFDEAMT